MDISTRTCYHVCAKRGGVREMPVSVGFSFRIESNVITPTGQNLGDPQDMLSQHQEDV